MTTSCFRTTRQLVVFGQHHFGFHCSLTISLSKENRPCPRRGNTPRAGVDTRIRIRPRTRNAPPKKNSLGPFVTLCFLTAFRNCATFKIPSRKSSGPAMRGISMFLLPSEDDRKKCDSRVSKNKTMLTVCVFATIGFRMRACSEVARYSVTNHR